jgi:hypothetical protein
MVVYIIIPMDDDYLLLEELVRNVHAPVGFCFTVVSSMLDIF